MTDRNEPTTTPGLPGERQKKAYVKPAFRHERVFETTALACGKISGTQASCRVNRRNS
jgi:hypothetical protein